MDKAAHEFRWAPSTDQRGSCIHCGAETSGVRWLVARETECFLSPLAWTCWFCFADGALKCRHQEMPTRHGHLSGAIPRRLQPSRAAWMRSLVNG